MTRGAMRILYVAIDQTVPGTTGGSIHVRAVADGLAARGHDVHVLTRPAPGAFPQGAVHWHSMSPPFGLRQLRMARARRVRALAETLRPQVIVERYYNFGGESIGAARAVSAALVLEVNAPIVDYPGSSKALLDRVLLVEPLRRWREWQCRSASLIVTPSASIVPASVPREKILEIEWGADTERFHPGATGPVPFARRVGDTVAVFAGAFRSWHGAIHLVEAVRRLRARGRRDIAAVLIGDGPELARVRESASGLDGVTFTGALPHDRLPASLAAADIGVAPFDVQAHAPLALDFYWSPLKIFEYMASGLPTVTIPQPPLTEIVRDGQEGCYFDEGSAQSLADALTRLAGDAGLRRRLGQSARERVVARYSWARHCEQLERVLQRIRS